MQQENDNYQGMIGDKNHNAKLDWNKVDAIRASYGKITQRELAEIYGVNRSCIARIHNETTWKPEKRPKNGDNL